MVHTAVQAALARSLKISERLAWGPLLDELLTDEERVLSRDLPGYAAYLSRVRYRLVPFVW